MQRPVMILEGCELVGHARFRGLDGLVRNAAECIAGGRAKPFIGAKFDL